MANLDYLRWEWNQYFELWYFEPSRMLSLYVAASSFGLMVLHGIQLFRAERCGAGNKLLRRKFSWDVGIFVISLLVLCLPVF